MRLRNYIYFFVILVIAALYLSTKLFAGPIDFDNLQPRHWYEIPNTKLQDVFPNPAPPGTIGPKAVTDAWSGGAFDIRRERLILWGGGHTDYSGNEIYVFDINASVPKWERVTEPSMNVGGDEASGVYPDGLPRSRHSINLIEYIPSTDQFCAFGGFGYKSGSVPNNFVHCYDFSAKKWMNKESLPPGFRRAFAVYDPIVNGVWYRPGRTDGIYRYDPINHSWSPRYGTNGISYHVTPALDTKRHHLVGIGYGQFFLWDLDNPDSATKPPRSGDSRMEDANYPGFQYDPIMDKFVAWHGGSSVYLLDPLSWAWTRLDSAHTNSVTPPAAVSQGTFGRFRYIPSKNAYILYNHYNQNVYIYKLSGGGPDSSSDPFAPAPPKDLKVQ